VKQTGLVCPKQREKQSTSVLFNVHIQAPIAHRMPQQTMLAAEHYYYTTTTNAITVVRYTRLQE
jgi:hypothetical protein